MRRAPSFAGLLVAVGLAFAGTASGFVPKPERALAAVAQANIASGRTQAIALDLVMRVGDADAIATGELISHPSGLARLELQGAGGRVDRYLLSGTELSAAKNGETLDQPQPMLQPVFLLQPASQETLRVALESFGVDSRWIGLAPCGESDCYVFGDPALAVVEPRRIEVGADGANDPLPSEGTLELEPLQETENRGPVARLWVETETLQVKRIDRESGVTLELGPLARFERLMVPAWLEIHEPGQPVIHFDVKRAIRVNATPQAFNPSWLEAPTDPSFDSPFDPEPTGPSGGTPAAPSPAPAVGPAVRPMPRR